MGLEREMAKKPAGMRTNMLISGGSAFFVALSEIMISSFWASDPGGSLRYNPISVIEAIVVGISFIGAGTIIQLQEAKKVENLTTAATILFSAGIGISVALEQFRLAIGAALIALIVNYLLGKVEDRMTGKVDDDE